MTQALARYSVTTLAAVAFVALLLTRAFDAAGASAATAISAAVAVVVQMAAFALTRSMAAGNMVAAWGAGALVRMLTLFVYAVLAVKVFGLSPAPALVSIGVFFFLSTLLEPVFLRR